MPRQGAWEELWGSEEKLTWAWMLAEATPAAPAGGGRGNPRKAQHDWETQVLPTENTQPPC